MNQQRPVNLDLGSLKFPPMAIASILHRISGLILFLLLPVMLYGLHCSLTSPEGFQCLHDMVEKHALCKLMVWGFASAWIYHVFAGVRHLLMDAGFGETVTLGRMTAWLVIALGILGVVLVGVSLWSM